jgi:hypothetical protein
MSLQPPPQFMPDTSTPAEDTATSNFRPAADKLEEVFFWSGISESSEADDLLVSYSKLRDDAVAFEKVAFEQDMKSFADETSDLVTEREAAALLAPELERRLDEIRPEMNVLQAEHETIQREILSKELVLRARRLQYPLRFFEKRLESARGMISRISERFLSEEVLRFRIDQELFQIASQRRELNVPEYDRRLEVLNQRVEKASVRLLAHEAYLDRLRAIGITRTTAGFLIWCGYLAFVALGWFAGEAIRALHQGQDNFLQRAFEVVVAGLSGLFPRLGAVPALLLIILGPLAGLALLALLLIGWDRLMAWFDPTWKVVGKRRRNEDREGFLRWVAEPGRVLGRRDYVQFLARLPVFYLWALVPIGFAYLASLAPAGRGVGGQAPDPSESLLYTYFGVVLAVVVAGFVLVYAIKVLEPRQRALLMEDSPTLGRTLRANAELMGVITLLLAVLLSDLWSPLLSNASSPWAVRSTLSVGLLMLVNGFILSYGLLFRGAYRDLDVLKAEAQAYEVQSQAYAALPSVSNLSEDTVRFQEELATLQTDLTRRWQSLEFGWEGRPRGWSWTREMRLLKYDTQEDFTWRAEDELFEPELLAETTALYRKRAHVDSRLNAKNEEWNRIQQRLSSLKNRNWDEMLRGVRNRAHERRELHLRRVDEIQTTYTDRVLRAKTARALGAQLRGTALRDHL